MGWHRWLLLLASNSESSLTSCPSLLPWGLGTPRRHLTWIRFFSTLSWTKSIPILFSRWYRHSSATCRKQWEMVCSPCSLTQTWSGGTPIYLGSDLFYPKGNLLLHIASHCASEWLSASPATAVRCHDSRWVQYLCLSHRFAVQVKSARQE